MGLRGPGAKPVKKVKRATEGEVATFKSVNPDDPIAEQVISWPECLPVPSGMLAGNKMRLMSWQKEIVRGLYPPDRSIRQGIISVPRKNGKTGLVAGFALCSLCGPLSETMGEVYSAAADKAQAAITFRVMKAIIEAIPELSDRIIIRQFDKTMEDVATGSIYRALSADVATKHGLSASFVVCDELAQWPSRSLWDVLSTSTGARAHPLVIATSTQSHLKDHLMSELVDYGKSVMAGGGEDSAFYAAHWEAPEDADPWSEETWRACNPALGVIRSIEDLRSSAKQAQRMPTREPAFRNLYLNQRTSDEGGFMPVSDWLACQGELPDLEGQVCHIGMDLASVSDLAAVAAYFPDTGAVKAWCWVSEKTSQDGRIPYDAWISEGIAFRCGKTIDKRRIVQFLGELTGKYDVQSVSYDRWGMSEVQRLIEEDGVYTPETLQTV